MKRIYFILFFLWCGLVPFYGHSQVQTTTLTATKDTYIDTRVPNNNYGTNQYIRSGTSEIAGPFGVFYYYHQRVFVQFNLSSIPSNAVVVSAKLQLTRWNTALSTNHNWKTKHVLESWIESGLNSVTAADQPDITDITGNIVTTAASTAVTQEMDVTNMVQRMVYGSLENHGWCVQVEDEGYQGNSGMWFYSREHTVSGQRPKLIIEYYEPYSLSNVVVTHESATGASDGGVSFSLLNGATDTTYTYNWINSSGSAVGTTNSPLTGVPDGWYGLEVTGGTPHNEKFYMGFLVGTQCEEVTIAYETRPEFTSNAWIYDYNHNGIDYTNTNYGNTIPFRTQNWENSPDWPNMKSYLDFNTWMDADFTINQADLLIHGWNHYNLFTTNTSELVPVSSYWHENFVTWNAPPTNTSSPLVTVPNTSFSTQDFTLDMTDFWDDWKLDNNTNYGVFYRLQAHDNDYNTRTLFYSPNGAVGERPYWTFKLDLSHPNNPLLCSGAESRPYNVLKKDLDGGYAESYNDTLNFTFVEDYSVDANLYLTTTIYNDDHVAEATCNEAGTTTGGMPALAYNFDDNRYVMDLSGITTLVNGHFYVLEVQNSKGIRHYLKFKHND